MAYDENAAKRIQSIIGEHPGLVEKKMFGGVGFMLQGNMVCGVNKDDLIVRVGPDNYDRLVVQPHARPFDFTGRPMRGWVMVAPDGYVSEKDLNMWVQRGVDFALSLPPK